MKEFRADLHCHSNCSDGTNTPEELVQMALNIGLSGFSITDHDSIDAYAVAMPLAQKLGLQMISGAEFSSVHGPTSVHVLAYSFNLDNPHIQGFCEKHNQRRLNRIRDILKLLAKHGMQITEAEVEETMPPGLPKSRRTVGRPHIALVMIKKGYVETVQDAFKKDVGDGKCCYAPGESFTTEETLNVIHKANGLAVIAHPHLQKSLKVIHQLLEMKFDGLECYYGRFNQEQQEPWIKLAEKKGLLVTGGSDYHGDIKPEIHLGCSWINQEAFLKLYDHFKKNHPRE